jgi:hypothetical protein
MNTEKLSKTLTYKPKDALRAVGIDIPANQRGRMSRENVEIVKSLVGEGYSIVGYGAVKPVPNGTAPVTTPEKVERTATDPNVIAELYIRYDEQDYRAVGKSGTVYSMREVCQTKGCGGYSLVGHFCDSPTVRGENVEVVRRT